MIPVLNDLKVARVFDNLFHLRVLANSTINHGFFLNFSFFYPN